MADIKQLERALIKADAAGDADAAKAFASEIRKMRTVAPQQESSVMSDIAQGAGNVVAGAVRGAGSIGATILAPYDMAKDALAGKGLSLESNRQRRADMDAGLQTMGAQPDSLLYQGGKLGGEIAGTAGVGGALANGVRAVAPGATGFINALATSGMRAGTPAIAAQGANLLQRAAAAAPNMLTRVAGGGITVGASAALINPEDAGTGAAVGAALPPTLAAVGRAARYVGGAAGSLVKPFTAAGVDEIAGNVVRRFAEGGPTSINASQIVPRSAPTLAEATGNAGLSTLQRGTRDLRPNAFVEREQLNGIARLGLFDEVAGDAAKVGVAKTARDEAADALYGKAFTADAMRRDLAKSAQATRAPFGGVGLSGAPEDLATPGLRELAQRPLFKQAAEDAKRLAANKGHDLKDPLQSLEGLHYIKLALDDMMNPAAKSAMGRNASGAVNDMRHKLADELGKVSPLYGNARQTYAEMSGPANAMETLQGLKLTDAQGNITLAKAQNAIRGLEQKRQAAGIDPAKSITDDQMASLVAIRDDLLRQANLGLGRSAGSNTFQNIATDNILNSFMGNSLTKLADKVGVSGLAGQAGRLLYSGPNEAIRNRLVDMMLDPQLATNALSGQPLIGPPNRLMQALTSPSVQQPIYRAAPVLGTSR